MKATVVLFLIGLVLGVCYFQLPLWTIPAPQLDSYSPLNVAAFLGQGLAFLSFSWFGLAAYYLPFLFIYLGWVRLRPKRPDDPSLPVSALRNRPGSSPAR